MTTMPPSTANWLVEIVDLAKPILNHDACLGIGKTRHVYRLLRTRKVLFSRLSPEYNELEQAMVQARAVFHRTERRRRGGCADLGGD